MLKQGFPAAVVQFVGDGREVWLVAYSRLAHIQNGKSPRSGSCRHHPILIRGGEYARIVLHPNGLEPLKLQHKIVVRHQVLECTRRTAVPSPESLFGLEQQAMAEMPVKSASDELWLGYR